MCRCLTSVEFSMIHLRELLGQLQGAVPEAEAEFLEWFALEHPADVLNMIKDTPIEDAQRCVQTLSRAAAAMELTDEDWRLFLYTDIIFPHCPLDQQLVVDYNVLRNAGLKHPLQLEWGVESNVEEALKLKPLQSQQLVERCKILSVRGAATLKEAFHRSPWLESVACQVWAPECWQPISTAMQTWLPKVEFWDTCDFEIKACIRELPDTGRVFPLRSELQSFLVEGPASYTSAYHSWTLAPTELVNIALRLRVHNDPSQQQYQWQGRLTPRMYSRVEAEPSALAAEALHMTSLPEFTLQQRGSDGPIVSAYDMNMGSLLMWHSVQKDSKPPQFTTQANIVYQRHSDSFIKVAAWDLVNIINNRNEMTGLDDVTYDAVCTALGRVAQFCSGRDISIMMFGNGLYTWVAKLQEGKLMVSRPYHYCDEEVTLNEVAYMVSCKAIDKSMKLEHTRAAVQESEGLIGKGSVEKPNLQQIPSRASVIDVSITSKAPDAALSPIRRRQVYATLQADWGNVNSRQLGIGRQAGSRAVKSDPDQVPDIACECSEYGTTKAAGTNSIQGSKRGRSNSDGSENSAPRSKLPRHLQAMQMQSSKKSTKSLPDDSAKLTGFALNLDNRWKDFCKNHRHVTQQAACLHSSQAQELISGGFMGPVLSFKLADGQEAAVKLAPCNTKEAAALVHEACVLNALQPLWDRSVPRLLAAGESSEGGFVLGTKLIAGARHINFKTDRGLRQQLMQAVKLMHSCNIVHNRLDEEHILVEEHSGATRIWLIDFGWATFTSWNKRLMKDEKEGLGQLIKAP